MKYFVLILSLFSQSVFSQNSVNPSLRLLENYSQEFDIQFAYNPDKIGKIDLSEVENISQLISMFEEANISILKISDKRWLLKSQDLISQTENRYYEGKVVDSNGDPLVSALIYTGTGQSSALTLEDGSFILERVSVLEEICCQYLGYEVQCLSNGSALNFELEPIAMQLEGIKIETKKVQCSMKILEDAAVLKLKTSSLSQSSLASDVIRSVKMLGGVDATNDLSAAMTIRATSGLQSLVTLDGIPIYNAESAFGMFSVLNPLVVTEAKLFKNSMPLEYGEFTGGYLECVGLTKVQDKVKLNIDLNTLQTMAAIQVPIGPSTQISGAFRRSNGRISNSQYYSQLRSRKNIKAQVTSTFERPDRVSTSLENRFGDVYLNLNHAWRKDNKFSVSIFGNRDVSGTSYGDQYLWERENKINLDVDEKYSQSKTKANLGLSLEYSKKLKSKAEWMIRYYSSAYNLLDLVESDITISNRDRESIFSFDSQIRNEVRDRNLKFQYLTDRSKKWSWKAGVDFRRIDTDFGFRSLNVDTFKQTLELPTITPYLGTRFNYKDLFIADIGFRYAIVPIKNAVGFASPRAKILLKLEEGLYLKSSASFNQQFFRPIEIERQLGQATSANVVANFRNIPLMQSAQLTMGMDYFKSGFKINGDIFLRENTGILEQVLSRPGLSDESNIFGNNKYELFEGINKVVGIDVSSGYEKERFTGLLSYTLTRSQDQFIKLFNNTPIPDQNNRTHQVNIFGSYEIGKWILSSTYIYGSGVYTLNRSAIGEAIDRGNVNPDKLFKQLPSYKRLDINASYKIKLKYGILNLDVGIFNLLDYNNVTSEIYIYSLKDEDKTGLGASEVGLLGRIWTLGVRYEL